LPVFGVALGFLHLASGDAYGGPTSLPWAVELWGARRHPTQIYEILLSVLILLALWRLRRWDTFPGFFFLCWLAMAAEARLFLEAFRADSAIIFGMLRGAQVVSLIVLQLAMLGLHLLGRRILRTRERAD
jgi:prolipoprotein diacylglyceryltransferase